MFELNTSDSDGASILRLRGNWRGRGNGKVCSKAKTIEQEIYDQVQIIAIENCNEEEGSEIENAAHMNAGQVLLNEFIRTLESMPELWDPTSPGYRNRTKRNDALIKLMGVYKRIKDDCTIDDVRKKINSLRSNYRKELKKILESKLCGKPYTPKSPTFHSLQFLKETEQDWTTSSTSTENMESSEIIVEGSEEDVSIDLQPEIISPKRRIPQPLGKRKQTEAGLIAKQNKLIENACALLEPSATLTSSMAKVWAEKVCRLEQTQRILAEKAINDILFEAELGTLTRNSVKINEISETIEYSNVQSTTTASTSGELYVPKADFIEGNNARIELLGQDR